MTVSSLPSWIPTGADGTGDTYWVATTGDDTTGDGSYDNPWKTINKAVNAVGVGAGDTVMVRPGTYTERIFFWRGEGSPDGQLTVKSEVPGAALIRNGTDYPYPFIVDGNYITIDGFDVSGGPNGSGISIADAHHVVIRNNIIHDSGLGGTGSYRSEFVVFDNNVVYGNAYNATNNPSGISIYLPKNITGDTTTEGPRNIVTNNVIYDNYLRQDNSFVHTDGNGIIMDTFRGDAARDVPDAYAYGALVENNLVYDNGGHGIHVFKSDYITVRNNTVANNNWDPYATYTWRGELSNVNGNNNTWVNNIAIANTSTNPNNTAVGNNSSAGSPNLNVVWENNLTFNGTAGNASLNISSGNSRPTAQGGNILGADPKLANISAADFTLLTGSPALNAGSSKYGLSVSDVAGLLRAIGTVDIGAHEKPATGSTATSAKLILGSGGHDTMTGDAGNDTLRGGAGNDVLDGGRGDDVLVGGDGMDTARYSGSVAVVVDLAATGPQPTGLGRDSLTSIEYLMGGDAGDSLTGNTGANRLWGMAGHDTLSGADGNDSLYGAEGNDVLFGGAGNDSLSGGDGNDTLRGEAGADTLDGGKGTDMASYAAAVAALKVDLANSSLNGGAAQGDVLQKIEGIVAGAGNDTLSGDALANRLEGGAGNDWMEGRDGADTLLGGSGNDTVSGGAGEDVLNGGDGTDTLLLDLATAVTVDLSVVIAQATGQGSDLISNIENIVAGTGGDLLTGSASANDLQGNGGDDTLAGLSGNDRLFGGEGNDLLDGGAGDDLLTGGNGLDTARFSGAVAVSVDLSVTTAQATGLGSDTLVSIENLLGGSAADSLRGNDSVNVLSGDGGNDLLWGNGGNDTLFGGGGNDFLSGGTGADRIDGGAGDDTLRGGDGADAFVGGDGIDTADYSTLTTPLVIDMSLPSRSTGFASGDSFSGIERLLGTTGSDSLVGTSGAESLYGGLGDDTLSGVSGADALYGDAGNDVFQTGTGGSAVYGGDGIDTLVSTSASDLAVNLATGSSRIGTQPGTTIAGVENVTGGTGNDSLTGDALANLLTGNGGKDTLAGGDGNDTLNGGAGDDVLTGGNGSDAALYLSGANVTVDLQILVAQVTGEGSDILSGIENLRSGAGNDRLTGDTGANILNGGAGNDTILGNLGNDLLRGAEGNDQLDGGGGNDTLDGGDGIDTLVFAGTIGVTVNLELTTAQDSGRGIDTLISIENLTGSSANDLLTGNAGANRLFGDAGNDTLRGGAGADTLLGGDGADTLNGGAGTDLLTGGAGADRFVFNSGFGRDTVTDYQDGIDHIAIATGAESFAALTVSDLGSDTVITFSDVTITLTGMDHTLITAQDFVFL